MISTLSRSKAANSSSGVMSEPERGLIELYPMVSSVQTSAMALLWAIGENASESAANVSNVLVFHTWTKLASPLNRI